MNWDSKLGSESWTNLYAADHYIESAESMVVIVVYCQYYHLKEIRRLFSAFLPDSFQKLSLGIILGRDK